MKSKTKVAFIVSLVIVASSAVYKFTNIKKDPYNNIQTSAIVTKKENENDSSYNSLLRKILASNSKQNIENIKNDDKLSSEIADELLLIYTNSKKIKEFNKEKALKDLAEQILNSFPQKKYEKSDIKINKNISLSQYNESLKLALSPLYELNEYELELIAKTYANFDEKDFAKVKKYHDAYKEVVENLKNLGVAPDFAQLHLSLLNAYEKIRLALLLIYLSKNDTILAYSGLRAYLKAENDLINVQRFVNNYIKNHVQQKK